MKSEKKHSKKAVTLLTQIEKLLANVLAQCSEIENSVEKNVRELLLSAEKSIVIAKDFFTPAPTGAVRKKVVKHRKPVRGVAAAKSKPRALKAKRAVAVRTA